MRAQLLKFRKAFAFVVAFAILVCMCALPHTANAAELPTNASSDAVNVKVVTPEELDAIAEKAERAGGTLLQDAGQLSPGQSRSGYLKLSNWFGTDFTVYMAVSSGASGYVGLRFVSSYFTVNCGDSVVITRQTGWSAGDYYYSLTSYASAPVGYSLMVLEN